MHKVSVIFAREYKAQVQSKAFVISLVLMPLLMTASVMIQNLARDQVDVTDKKVAVVDHTGCLFKGLVELAESRNQSEVRDEQGNAVRPRFLLEEVSPAKDPASQRLELSDRVRAEELFAFVELSPGILQGDGNPEQASVRYYSNSPTQRELSRWIQGSVNQLVQAWRFEQANLPREAVLMATRPVSVENLGLASRSESGQTTEAEKTDETVFIVPFGLMMLMFMGIMVGATPLLQAIIEEKMQRIADVLLGSVSPFQLMLGKLLGVVGVSLTMIGVYLAGGLAVLLYFDRADLVSTSQIGWLLAYSVLAILMYGSLFCAIGASCSEIKDAQSLMAPVMILIMLPMFFLGPIMESPSAPLALFLSFFPPVTPMFMIVRMGIPPGVPLWQPVLGIFGVLIFTVLCVFAAARIFRVGILMQGKPPKLTEMVRWVIRG